MSAMAIVYCSNIRKSTYSLGPYDIYYIICILLDTPFLERLLIPKLYDME